MLEILLESITPCGGEAHARREFLEVEAEDPRKFVEENSRFPIMAEKTNADGDLVITTGNGKGYVDRYTFTG